MEILISMRQLCEGTMKERELKLEIKRLRTLNANKDAVISQLQLQIGRYKEREEIRKEIRGIK
jgi:hypothetical protein